MTRDWNGQGDTENWPSQYLSRVLLQNLEHLHYNFFFCMYLDLHSNMLSLGSKISDAYWCCVFVTDSRKKNECLLEILNYNMPSPDLSSFGMWGLAQTWVRRTVSLFWSLSIPHPSERVRGLSNVSVWVTVVSWSRLPTSCRIGGF